MMYSCLRNGLVGIALCVGCALLAGQGQPVPVPAGCHEDSTSSPGKSQECNALIPCSWVSACSAVDDRCESCDGENWHFGCQQLDPPNMSERCQDGQIKDSAFCIENYGCGERFTGTCIVNPEDASHLLCDKDSGLGETCDYRTSCRDL